MFTSNDDSYLGKLLTSTAAAHTLTIVGGPVFQGFGATGNVATFSSIVGSFITFLVLANGNVQILAKDGVSVP